MPARSWRFFLLLVAISICDPPRAVAQGLSGASLQGIVVSLEGPAVRDAVVTLIDASTGFVRQAKTGADGRFLFESVAVGGPFALSARSVGFAPASIDSLFLHLGDRLVRRLVLGASQAQPLRDVEVRESGLRNPGAGGPAYSIPANSIRNLPVLNRDFVGLLAIAPQATGSTQYSLSGQHAKLNSIQVDGGSSNDFLGINVTPGVSAGAKVISMEALQEIRILVAPFDVRQGEFSGGLINAITRRGTNSLQGSVFTSLAGAFLVGRDTSGATAGNFSTTQYGATIGGPIVRDRIHFFAVVDLQSSRTPFAGQAVSDPAIGISEATARRAQQVFRDKYGFDPGGPEAPVLFSPSQNALIKLSAQISRHHWADVTQSWAGAKRDALSRIIGSREQWQLSGSGTSRHATNPVTRLRVTSAAGSVTNEIMASIGTAHVSTESKSHTPLFLVQADVPAAVIAAGSSRGAQGTATSQRLIEVTDNISWNRGSHVITLGTQNQFLHVRDNLFVGSWGAWTFGSVDSLEKSLPSRYEVALPLRPGGPFNDYRAKFIAGYLQDEWRVSSRLTLTGGIRGDVPFSNSPVRNPALAASDALGNIDTSDFPSGNAVWSPRLGFALDLNHDRSSMLRGGIGVFAGRPPLVWIASAFTNTGLEQALLTCRASDGVPQPTVDITNLPSRCRTSQPTSTAVSTINYVDPDYRFQHAIKYVLGFDRNLGSGLHTSIDVIHTRTRNHTLVDDVNLVVNGATSEGRVMYGTVSASGAARATRVDANYGPVFFYHNLSRDRSTSVAVVASRQWLSGAQLEVGYNWSRTEDVMTVLQNTAALIFQRTPLDGSIADRRVGRSSRDIPHNVVATTIIPVPFGLTVSAFFRARSGTPYAYIVGGDANADGTTLNDLAYIPRDANDITLADPSTYSSLNDFIEREPCLRSQRGRVMHRNTCRNPAATSLDLRLAKSLSIRGGKSLTINADVFNLPNLVSRRWGLVRETSAIEGKQGPLMVSGWDAAANRPSYSIAKISGAPVIPGVNGVVVDASRWRMQVGARYSF